MSAIGIDLSHHIALTSSDDISQITLPLKKFFGITYFNYVKLYKNGSRIILTDRADFIGYFYQNGLWQNNAVAKLEKLDQSSFHLWHEFNGQPSFIIGKEKFSIDNGITVAETYDDYTELYYFGTLPENNSIIGLYLRNFDVLQHFILYFKEKAHAIIQKADRDKIILPPSPILREVSTELTIKDKIEMFFDATPIEKIYVDENKGIYLTKREAACLHLLLKGNTAKQIGKVLSLSNRTIEDYITSIKNKLNVSSKKELIIKAIETNLNKKLIHSWT
jgi:DNA-binding CsgD family transcriptional regulator